MQRTANHWFHPAIIFIMALSPLFLGSHRPFFWAFWAVVSLVILSVYLLALYGSKVPLVPIDRPLKAIFILFLCFLLFVILQIAPLDKVFGPIAFISRDGDEVLSNALSISAGNSLLGLLRWITYGIIFFIVLQISYRNQGRSRSILRGVAILVALYAFYGILALFQFGDTVLTLEKWAYRGFATGPFINRNSFATFLGLGAVVALCFVLEKPSGDSRSLNFSALIKNLTSGRKPLLAGCFLIICFTLILTVSRMGIFATLSALAVVFAMHLNRKQLVIFVILILVFGTPATTIFILGSEDFLGRLILTEESFAFRVGLYRDVIDMIAARPWLGYGLGSFEYAYPLFHSERVSMNLIWHLAHSTYLGNWADMGLVFGSLPLIMFLCIFLVLLRGLISHKGSVEIRAAIGCLILVAMHSLVDFSLEIHAVAIYTTVILALAYASILRAKTLKN